MRSRHCVIREFGSLQRQRAVYVVISLLLKYYCRDNVATIITQVY